MSPRPKTIRKVRGTPYSSGFVPGICLETDHSIVLFVEEYEAIHLCDYEGMTQAEAAASMGVSRPTLTRIYASAREKVARALVERKAFSIEGGSAYKDAEWFECRGCGMLFNNVNPGISADNIRCPGCGGLCQGIRVVHYREAPSDQPGRMQNPPDLPDQPETEIETEINLEKYKDMKKIALPSRNGYIDDHFGHCEFYTIVTVNDNNQVVMTETIPSPQGCGCKSNIAYQLQEDGVTLMLAGNMGMGALNKLSSCGIEVIRGCSGPIMDVVEAYLKGQVSDSGESCHHHGGEGHECHHE